MHIKTGQVITFAKKGRFYFRADIVATIDNVEVFAKYFSTVPVASKTEYDDAAIWSTDNKTGIHTVGRIPNRPKALWNGIQKMKSRQDAESATSKARNTESATREDRNTENAESAPVFPEKVVLP